MISSLTKPSIIKQYVPGFYFAGIATWMAYQEANLWMGLIIALFIIQMLFNNRYINLILGFLTILWSLYMLAALFYKANTTINYMSITLLLTVLNFYMSRMLFLNQNFTLTSLRENSLDEILFL